MKQAIQTYGLTKYYGKARGIIDLNLSVNEGDFFGFIGPNGAGKSTTIRCLLGLISSSKGRAEIFGKDTVMQKQEILADIGYMPSEAMFYHGMRVRDMIKLSADLRGKACEAEAAVLCERLQLDVNKKIEELSLGNRKKVAIVCAFQHNPGLYILDEPTSGLDPLMQREFFELLKERHVKGATIFLSSHVLSEIQQYCNRAAIIREGRLIACDTVQVLSQTAAKRIVLKGVTQMPEWSSIRDRQVGEDSISFLYSGDMNALIHELSEKNVRDMTIAEPNLEEIFMHYYVNGGDAK